MANPLAWIQNLWSSIPGLGKKSGQSQRSPAKGKLTLKSKSSLQKGFDSFLLLPIDDIALSPLARGPQITQLASQIAIQLREALDESGRLNSSLVELYTPGPTWRMLAQAFNTSTRMDEFEQICTTEIFGVNSPQGSSAGQHSGTTPLQAGNPQSTQRVYLVRRPLNFDPAFEKVLQGKLLVRTLGEGGVSIPTDPTEYRRDADQILIGELKIFDVTGREVDSPLMWAWRAIRNEHTIQVHVDFDVLSRFVREELHRFPLGALIQCTMRLLRRKREMQDVTLFVKEAAQWKSLVPEVTYYVETRAGREFVRNPIDKDSFPDEGEIHVSRDTDPRDKESYPLGADENGNAISIDIDRQLKIIARSEDTTYYYVFRFFERAINYRPGMNQLQVTGQLIPSAGRVTVYLPPSLEHEQTPLFQLTPKPGAPGRFDLMPLNQKLKLAGTSQGTSEISPGQSKEVSIGETIEFAPVFAGSSPSETIKFELRDLDEIPTDVLNNKNYAAFIYIESRRVSVLSAREYVLGPNVFFAPEVSGMERDAITFERPNVFTKLRPAEDQDVWFYDKYSTSIIGGKPTVQKVSSDGKQLALNGFYIIFVGEFQLSLNLRPTPSSEV